MNLFYNCILNTNKTTGKWLRETIEIEENNTDYDTFVSNTNRRDLICIATGSLNAKTLSMLESRLILDNKPWKNKMHCNHDKYKLNFHKCYEERSLFASMDFAYIISIEGLIFLSILLSTTSCNRNWFLIITLFLANPCRNFSAAVCVSSSNNESICSTMKDFKSLNFPV